MRYFYALVVYAAITAPAYGWQTAYAVRNTEIKKLPYSDSATVGKLDEKASVSVMSRQGGWVRISSAKGNGWVRMLSLRGDSTTRKSGDTGLQSLINVGRSGSSGIAMTTGVRGLTEEDLKNAQPNPEEFEKLQKYAANKTSAEKFARDAKLKSQQLDYLPQSGK
ncbi:MAG TPA: SH3 domain-containing protein [Gallionella sp.]|nr:SH3 domain-containing protein [Gallionella sp.]